MPKDYLRYAEKKLSGALYNLRGSATIDDLIADVTLALMALRRSCGAGPVDVDPAAVDEAMEDEDTLWTD